MAYQAKASSKSCQSSTIKKGSLTRIKESKWAINFISKLIYWFNFLRISSQSSGATRSPFKKTSQGASPVSYWIKDW